MRLEAASTRPRAGVGTRTGRQRGRRVLPALALVVLAGLLGATACTATQVTAGSEQPTGTISLANRDLVQGDAPARRGGKLVYGLNAETNGWNPGTNQWGPAGLQVARTIFDTLAAFDEHSQVHPYLAEGFDHDDTYTRWTIRLRAGVTLHNGKPVTAETVRRNQAYLMSSPVTRSVYAIVASITTDGDRKVVFTMTQPWATFPMAMATQVGVVADADWLESNDGLKPVGTGPFRMDSWEIGSKLVVHKNDAYWQRDARGEPYPYLDAVEFRVIVDGSSREAALRAGDIDLMEATTAHEIADFQGSASDVQVFSAATGETPENFIMLNTKAPPFDDVDARRALAYATDKQAYIDTVGEGLYEPADGPWRKGSPWYADSGYPQFDQAKARELVDAVKRRHGSFRFTVNGSSEPGTQQSLQVLQQQWAAVGIDMQIALLEQATMIINVVTGGYQAVSWQQFDAPYPTNDSVWWSSRGAMDPPAFSLNFARNGDQQIEDALNDALATTDLDRVRRDVAIVQQRFGADVPYVWLYHSQIAIVASSRVVNIVNYVLPDGAKGLDLVQGSHPLHQVWLAR